MRVTAGSATFRRRVVRLGFGLVLYGLSIALMIQADLGVDSWDVLHQGLALVSGISFGWVVTGVSVLVLLLWVPLRQRPGPGTLANAVVVGLVADLALRALTPPRGLVAQLATLALGIVANGVATGLYIGAGLGPGPRDGLMTGLAARTNRSIRSVRTMIEVSVLAAGWTLDGQVGVGTLLYAGSIGPLSQYFIHRLAVVGTTQEDPEPLPFAARPGIPVGCLGHGDDQNMRRQGRVDAGRDGKPMAGVLHPPEGRPGAAADPLTGFSGSANR